MIEPEAVLAATDVVDCLTCGEVEGVERECPGSQRPCGHHCNHIWTHDACHWCPAHINDDGELIP
jgi:hypothetical protein